MSDEELEEVEDYNDLTNRELLNELESRGLGHVKGNKAKLVAALEANDVEAEEDAPDETDQDTTAAQPDLAEDDANDEAPASDQGETAGQPVAASPRMYRAEFPLPVGGFSDAFHAECIAKTRQAAIDAGFTPRGNNLHSAHRVGWGDGTAVYEVSVRRPS